MNLTIWTDYHAATLACDEAAHETGVAHYVIERFPAGPVAGDLHEALVPDNMARAEHRYTVLSLAEWNAVKDVWDAEAQYWNDPQEVTG